MAWRVGGEEKREKGGSSLSVHSLEVRVLQLEGALASLQRDYEKLYGELVAVRKELWALKEVKNNVSKT